MNKVARVLLSILGVIVILAAGTFVFMTSGMSQVKSASVDTVSPSAVADGAYQGKYSNGRWSNEVQVTVKDHKITQISVVKDQLAKMPLVQAGVIGSILEKQSLNVDIVSGATITTKAYVKAVENALKAGAAK